MPATEITPLPPTATSGRVIQSSPESTVSESPVSWHSAWICFTSPVDSFTPKMIFSSASRARVGGSTLVPVRPGML